MTKPVINVSDARVHSSASGEHYSCTLSELARAVGARSIGANVTRVPAGKAAFPLHHHRANEEHFFILSGAGVLRIGAETWPVRPHDYIVNLPGGPELAHQLINTGSEDLVYLAISTVQVPEVVGYPDSGKTGIRISTDMSPESRFVISDTARNAVGYWEDEDGARVQAIVDEASRHG